MLSGEPRARWRRDEVGSGGGVVSLAQQIDASAGCLLALGSLDPGAADVETEAVVAGVFVIAADAAVMAGVAGTEHLFGLVF
jgi:hypothetical protein